MKYNDRILTRSCQVFSDPVQRHHIYSRNANYRLSKGLHKLLGATGPEPLILTFITFRETEIMQFFSERFTSQDIAVGAHQCKATCSVSCLLSSSSQPSCCPCCFFFVVVFFPLFLGRNADVCSFLCLRSLGFSGNDLQFKCNYCLSPLSHWQPH